MNGPSRVQMTRQRPWRPQHPDAVIVARPTVFGNPYRLARVRGGWTVQFDDQTAMMAAPPGFTPTVFPTRLDAARAACLLFDKHLDLMAVADPARYRQLTGLLSGATVACWCPQWDDTTPCPQCFGFGGHGMNPLDVATHPCPVCETTGCARYPCHGDLWLTSANPGARFTWQPPEDTR